MKNRFAFVTDMFVHCVRILMKHPGQILRTFYLPQTGMTVKAFAEHLQFSRDYLDKVLSCRQGISIDLALRLEKTFGVNAESWMAMQNHYDLHRIRQKNEEILDQISLIKAK